MNDDLDELLNQLKNGENTVLTPLPTAVKQELNDDNINQYILDKAKILVDNGIDAVEALKQVVISSAEAEEVSAYSDMYKSVVGALDTLTKITNTNKRIKAAKELKELEIKSKKELPGHTTNNNVLIASREDIIKNFLEKGKAVIDASFEDKTEPHEPYNEQR